LSYPTTIASYLPLYSIVEKVVKKTIKETITLTDAIVKDVYKSSAEQITLTDVFSRTFTKPGVLTYVLYGFKLTTRRRGDIIVPEDHNNKREVLIRLVERLQKVVEEVYG